MNRRRFIRTLAAALPAGVAASHVKAETDPIKAAMAVIREAIEKTAPEGYRDVGDIFLGKSGALVVNGFPTDYKKGDVYATYNSRAGEWRFTA